MNIPKLAVKLKRIDSLKVLLSMAFITLVFFPLARMFAYINIEHFYKVVTSAIFLDAVLNSLFSAVLATIITVVIAFALAICIQRTEIRFKNFFGVVFILPMLIPSISCGMGLVILFGNNGILTRLLNLSGGIYGLKGIVTGSVMYAFPVAYLMLVDVFRYEDGSPYEAAQVLGISKWHQFTSIMIPYLRKPLISVIFSVFTMIITDYGVPLMVGGKYLTVATVMYQEVIGQLDFGKGAVYGSILLAPAVVAFVLDLMNKDSGNSTYVIKPCQPASGQGVRALSYLCCGSVAVLTLLPIIAFCLLSFTRNYPNDLSFTFQNVEKAINLKAANYLVNSIVIAFSTAVIGTGIAFANAYLASRVKSGASRFLHLSSMTSAAIPGIVLGLSYVLTFNKTPIYGTIIILIMVNIIHFIASPYLMMYNSLSKINENLEGVAHTMGIDRLHIIKDVIIPICKGTLIEMFTYFFVNCMMTISAVSFLASTANKPVSLMINQFEAQMQLECAAVVSLAILTVNIALKSISFFLRKRKII